MTAVKESRISVESQSALCLLESLLATLETSHLCLEALSLVKAAGTTQVSSFRPLVPVSLAEEVGEGHGWR